MMEADRFLDTQIEVLDIARDMLVKEGLPQDDHHLDLALHALVRGVEIGLMDSQLADRILPSFSALPSTFCRQYWPICARSPISWRFSS